MQVEDGAGFPFDRSAAIVLRSKALQRNGVIAIGEGLRAVWAKPGKRGYRELGPKTAALAGRPDHVLFLLDKPIEAALPANRSKSKRLIRLDLGRGWPGGDVPIDLNGCPWRAALRRQADPASG